MPTPTLPRCGAADFWASCMQVHLLFNLPPSDLISILRIRPVQPLCNPQHLVPRPPSLTEVPTSGLSRITCWPHQALFGQPLTPRDGLQLHIGPEIGQQHDLYC